MSYAPNLVEEIWSIAVDKGYDHLFLNERGAAVADDHVIVNEQARIPIINIINHRRKPNGAAEFGEYWHTHSDNMEVISAETLDAVGEVLLELIYNRL
jgi:hypothetical protein